MSNDPHFKVLPISAITPSPTNPRKTFRDEQLAELAESIKIKGVLQPILVRPDTKNQTAISYELVAGERRYRASILAGLETIPAMVHCMDDGAALEVQTIENLQRADLDQIEEANGYKALIDTGRYTVKSLAAKVHKSESYILRRMKLSELPAAAQEAVSEGRMLFGTALAIARVPDAALREKATKWALDREGGYEGELPSPKTMHRYLADEFMRDLGTVSFDLKCENLLPRAGSCITCPKRTGNSPDLFGDVSNAMMCTDLKCLQDKATANWELVNKEAAAAGKKVLSLEESKKIMPFSDHVHYPHATLDQCCWDTPGYIDDDGVATRPTWKEALDGANYEVLVAFSERSGKVFEIIHCDSATKAAAAAGIDWAVRKCAVSTQRSVQQARGKDLQAIYQLKTKMALDAICNKVTASSSELLQILTAVVLNYSDDFDVEDFESAFATLGVPNPVSGSHESVEVHDQMVAALSEAMDFADVDAKSRVIVRMLLMRGSSYWNETDLVRIVGLKYGVDLDKLEKQAELELYPPEPKPKKKKKGAAAEELETEEVASEV